MRFASAQAGKLLGRSFGGGGGNGTDGQRDKQLIGVQTRVVIAEVVYFQLLDRLDYRGGDEVQRIVYARQRLQCVHQHSRGRAEEI